MLPRRSAELALAPLMLLPLLAACEGGASRDAAIFDPDAGPRAEAGARDLGAPDAEFVGEIYAFSRIYRADASVIESYAVTAGFAEAPTEVCTDHTPPFAVGTCTALRCVPRTPDAPDGGSRPTAGQIVIRGGLDPVYLFVLPGGVYQPSISRGSPLFRGGEMLTATAEGAEVAAFTIEVTAPERATLTAPNVPTPGTELEISRLQPLILAWTGATRGKIRFSVSVLELDTRNAIECEYPAAENRATISRDLLNTLPAGTGFYEFRLEDTTELEAGMYKVSFTAATNVIDSDRFWAHGAVVIR